MKRIVSLNPAVIFFTVLLFLGIILFYLYPDKENFGRGGRRNPIEGGGNQEDDLAGKGPYGNPLTPSDIYDDGYNYYPIYKYYKSFLYDPYLYNPNFYSPSGPSMMQYQYGWVPGGINGCPLRQGCYIPVTTPWVDPRKSRWWYW